MSDSISSCKTIWAIIGAKLFPDKWRQSRREGSFLPRQIQIVWNEPGQESRVLEFQLLAWLCFFVAALQRISCYWACPTNRANRVGRAGRAPGAYGDGGSGGAVISKIKADHSWGRFEECRETQDRDYIENVEVSQILIALLFPFDCGWDWFCP